MLDIPSFQALYHELDEYRGSHAYADVLQPWLPQAQQAMAVLGRYGNPTTGSDHDAETDLCNGGDTPYYSCLEHLYALSRVNDLLLFPFEPRPHESLAVYGLHPVAAVTADEYLAWWQALGMVRIADTHPFHPFFHEIVHVQQATDPDEPIQVIQAKWPGFLLGRMLFSRAGVNVRGGTQHIVKRTAETSRLYWTYARGNRPTFDLSHGWGHNSQWGTGFRRDYVTDEAFEFNVDADYPLLDADGNLNADVASQGYTPREAIEFLTHRCFISKLDVVDSWDEPDVYFASYREKRRW